MPKTMLISYVEKNSYIHKLNPLTKLTALLCVIMMVFVFPGFVYNVILFALIFPFAFIAKVNLGVFRPIRYLFIIFVLIFAIQGLFYPFAEGPFINLAFGFKLWMNGLNYAMIVSSRLIVMMVYGFLFVLTTHPSDLVSSLRKINLPFSLGYIIIATMQLIPRIQLQIGTIIEAQKSRGLRTEGNIIERFSAYLPLLGPLFLGSIQQAVERSTALEARAFSAKGEKTSYRQPRVRLRDKIIIISSILVSILAGVTVWAL